MQPKIEFYYYECDSAFFLGPRETTSCAVTCDAGIFRAEVVRDSRDQPNRKIARMRALEKALLPLPRAQRKEIWNAWHNRNSSSASSATPRSGSSPTISERTRRLATTIRDHISNVLAAE